MAQYTIELRTLIENGYDIGLKDYPIYDESHRSVLNNKIINAFYFDEIGQETPALFKHHLNETMNRIMDYYNQLYKSCDVEFNPLWNVDLTETYTATNNSQRESTTTDTTTNTKTRSGSDKQKSTNDTTDTTTNTLNHTNTTDNTGTVGNKGDNFSVKSDTTAGVTSIADIKGNVYASEGQHDVTNNTQTLNTKEATALKGTDTSSKTGKTTVNVETILGSKIVSENGGNVVLQDNAGNTTTYTRKQEGSSAGLPFSTAIKKWREIMINIDEQIIERLENEGLFFLLY